MKKEPSKIKPGDYRAEEEDPITSLSKIFKPEQFRAIMQSQIQKYVHQYEQTNEREDLEEAKYYIKRLAEWEEEE